MRRSIGSVLVAFVLGASGVASAQSPAKSRSAPTATVESLQLSATLERGRQTGPLWPGMELREGDRVNTGARSKLVLKLADGSTMKLGERGSLFFDRAQVRQDGVFDAAFFVAEGAFRFTTGVLEKLVGRREVIITVNNVTAGIRGTDLWGKSTSESDLVCLIEGSIEVTPPGERPFTMDQRLSYYELEGNVSKPVATVLPDKLAGWAAETEQQPGEGVSTPRGKWRISIASVKKSGEAFDAYNALRKAGYAAEIVPVKIGEERAYSVRLSKFESQQDAKSAVEAIKSQAELAKYDYKVGM